MAPMKKINGEKNILETLF